MMFLSVCALSNYRSKRRYREKSRPSPAGTARRTQLLEFAIHVSLAAPRRPPKMRIEHPQDSDSLLLAQASHACVIVDHCLADDFALRLRESLRSILKFRHRLFVERECDFHHTSAILPYRCSAGWQASAC